MLTASGSRADRNLRKNNPRSARVGSESAGGGLQLRLGGDGQWYRLVRSGNDWVLDGPPSPEPDALVADAPR